MSARETTYRIEVICGALAGAAVLLGTFASCAYCAVHGHWVLALAILIVGGSVRVKVKRSKGGSGEAVAPMTAGEGSRETIKNTVEAEGE